MLNRYTLLSLVLVFILAACSASPDRGAPAVQAAPPDKAQPQQKKIETSDKSTKKEKVKKEAPEKFPAVPPDSCPVTRLDGKAFVPPAPYSPEPPASRYFWYGSHSLWTDLPVDGIWADLPHNPEGYTQKIFWWREGYSWTDEPEPDLFVSGRRLDASAPELLTSKATNAYAEDIQSAMLVGVDFPTPGCWEVTGTYGSATLSFVVWVTP